MRNADPKSQAANQIEVDRWFLATGMGAFVFISLVLRYFDATWFSLLTILLIAVASLVCGLLFAYVWILLMRQTATRSRTHQSLVPSRPPAHLTSSAPALAMVEFFVHRLTTQEFVHLAAVLFVGVRWRAFKASCIALAVITPFVVALAKLRFEYLANWSWTIAAIMFGVLLIGVAVILALIFLASAANHVIRDAKSRPGVPYRISDRGMEIVPDKMPEILHKWTGRERLHETSRILVVEHDGRPLLTLSKREAIAPAIGERLKALIRSGTTTP